MIRIYAMALAFLAFLGAVPAHGQSSLSVAPYPRAVKYTLGDLRRDSYRNTDFTVRVRRPGGVWVDLYTHAVKVDWNNPQSASMVTFDFKGRVEVAIQKNNGSFAAVRIRPNPCGIKPKISGAIVHFTLDHPQNLSVEFDGDRLHNLHIFAGDSAIEKARPEAGPNTVIFGPGVHRPRDGQTVFRFFSGQTIYIEAGAILEAGLLLDGVHNVTVIGHGLIENLVGDVRMNNGVNRENSTESHIDGSAAIAIRNSRNIHIEGLTVINPPGVTLGCMQSQQIAVSDIKAFSAGPWADGMDIYSCQDVLLDREFIRSSDDCFALYNHRWNIYGDVRRIRVTNSVCWADVAHAMYLGLFGDSERPEVTEDILFKNIDVLEMREDQPDYQGVMAINDNNATLVRNVVFEDIRVDHITEGKLFNFRVIGHDRFSVAPGRGIENVTLRHISFSGQGVVGASVVEGFDATRGVHHLTLEDVWIAGKHLRKPERGVFEIGPFANDIIVQ